MPLARDIEIIANHFGAVQREFSGMHLVAGEDAEFPWVVGGSLSFDREYGGVAIADDYLVSIHIPVDYPEKIPIVRETGGRIPRDIDFHKYSDDRLCLAAPHGLNKVFFKDPTLLGLINNLIIPFCYANSYLEKYKKRPWPELAHAQNGIIQYYSSYFGIEVACVPGFLRLLASTKLEPRDKCPCGSERQLSKCHGEKIREASQYLSRLQFKQEYNQSFEILGSKIPSKLLSFSEKRRLSKANKHRH